MNHRKSRTTNPSRSRPAIASVNPATEELLRRFEPDSDAEVERKLQRATHTFEAYRRTAFAERARWLQRAGEILETKKQELARTMTLEMGKPIGAAVQEAEKCALACRFYAEKGAEFLADEVVVASGPQRSLVCYQPLGPILAIMPWNFPFWQVFRFAAPALMAGNVGLLKHASNVPQCALAIESIFRRAGFAEGIFQTLLVGSDAVAGIIKDQRVKAVTLTGSVGAGSSVASIAGTQIKKTVLELGGSDPFMVMPSAPLEQAVTTAVQARTINNGQSCIAAKRFIVHRRIADEFQQRFVERMAALRIGDPMDESTQLGPLATIEVLTGLQKQVDRTVQMGGRILLGGQRLPRPGFFFAPTVIADAPAGSPARAEELFGPVATLVPVENIQEAIRVANETEFGLGACLWTNDERERDLFIQEVQAGLAFVNGMVASDPKLPFGGIRQSGYGRELSHYGIREFTNIKTVVVNQSGQTGSRTE